MPAAGLPVPAPQLLLPELGTPGEAPGAELTPDEQFMKHAGLGSCAHTWGIAAGLYKVLSAGQKGRAERQGCATDPSGAEGLKSRHRGMGTPGDRGEGLGGSEPAAAWF